MEMRRFWDFLNSKLILLLLGFLLTTIVGSYLTGKFQLESRLYELRFNDLHQVRVSVIRKIYEKIVDVEDILETWHWQKRPVGLVHPFTTPKEAITTVRELRTFFEKNRINLSANLCKQIDSLCNVFEDKMRALETEEMFKQMSVEQKEYEQIQMQIELLKKSLEDEFRKILGVTEF